MKNNRRHEQSEAGVVSIIVATMLIIIMSLLVLAFAQVGRREQREALDTQLSTQAFYAAESGINDAKNTIANDVTNGTLANADKPDCGPNLHYTASPYLNADHTVAYTCLTVDTTPNKIPFTAGYQPTVVHLQNKTGGPITKITITWKPAGSSAIDDCPSSASNSSGSRLFKDADNWNCPYGVLRASLVSAATLSHTALLANQMTAFLVPTLSGTGQPAWAPGDAVISDASGCTNGLCSVTITGLPSGDFYLRLSSMYQNNVNVVITGNDGTVEFKDAVAIIDSTGKAQDVLRREVVAVPLATQSDAPQAALQSGDSVCKQFNVADGVFSANSLGTDDGSGNPLCGSTGP